MSVPVNPMPFVHGLVGKAVIVKLKWGMEYKGIMKHVDLFLNLHLIDAEEYIEGARAGSLGELVIRCNNILYIRSVENGEHEADKAAEEATAH